MILAMLSLVSALPTQAGISSSTAVRGCRFLFLFRDFFCDLPVLPAPLVFGALSPARPVPVAAGSMLRCEGPSMTCWLRSTMRRSGPAHDRHDGALANAEQQHGGDGMAAVVQTRGVLRVLPHGHPDAGRHGRAGSGQDGARGVCLKQGADALTP